MADAEPACPRVLGHITKASEKRKVDTSLGGGRGLYEANRESTH
jgi:hypothetical protein